jgi:hypothetical protein
LGDARSIDAVISRVYLSQWRDPNRCTRFENPGEGVPEFFAKIPRGSMLSGKIAWGVPPISGFIAFLLTSVLKFA